MLLLLKRARPIAASPIAASPIAASPIAAPPHRPTLSINWSLLSCALLLIGCDSALLQQKSSSAGDAPRSGMSDENGGSGPGSVASSAPEPDVPESHPASAGAAQDAQDDAAGEAGASGSDDSKRGDDDVPLGPTPATATARFPFPQNRVTHCQRPQGISNADVLRAFETWQTATVTGEGAGGALRVRRLPSDPNLELGSTVSEGIAYGLLIAVYMDQQELFDQLWRYEQQWLDDRGLMHWYINAAGTEVLGSGAASDADEDMAFALIMADRQWGGNGSLDQSYHDIAQDMVRKVWENEIIDGKGLIPGDGWGSWDLMNISYFAPSHYRTFARFSENMGWNDVANTSYDVLEASLQPEHGNSENGLVPAWSTGDGTPVGDAFEDKPSPTHYQYDSCRTPFRVGLDYCFYQHERAAQYLAKTSAFFAGIGAESMTDGYELDGRPRPEFGGHSAAFIGTAAVGALFDAAYMSFARDAYELVRTRNSLVGGEYYDLSWTVLSLLAMTGNLLDYTLIEPL